MPEIPTPDSRFATSEEVTEAFEALTESELIRLEMVGEVYIWGTEYTDPLELLGEAMKRALIGASDPDHGRHWPRKSVEFMAFLFKTMESIADGSRQSVVQRETVALEVLAGEDGDSEFALAKGGHFHGDVLEAAIELEETQERHAKAKADVELIERHFQDDQVVLAIL